MKLVRFGPAGQEKPGIIDASGTIRDVSSIVPDFAPETLTPELRLEGLARDVVRGVQDARKNAGLRMEDTIVTVYQAHGEVAEAIERFADYVRAETLSEDLHPGDPSADGAYTEEIKVGKDRVLVGIRPTGRTTTAVGGGEEVYGVLE